MIAARATETDVMEEQNKQLSTKHSEIRATSRRRFLKFRFRVELFFMLKRVFSLRGTTKKVVTQFKSFFIHALHNHLSTS